MKDGVFVKAFAHISEEVLDRDGGAVGREAHNDIAQSGVDFNKLFLPAAAAGSEVRAAAKEASGSRMRKRFFMLIGKCQKGKRRILIGILEAG